MVRRVADGIIIYWGGTIRLQSQNDHRIDSLHTQIIIHFGVHGSTREDRLTKRTDPVMDDI